MGVKEYELPDGRKAVFEFDENGVGKITIEAMDMLMEMIGAKEIENDSNTYEPTDFCSYGERRADE